MIKNSTAKKMLLSGALIGYLAAGMPQTTYAQQRTTQNAAPASAAPLAKKTGLVVSSNQDMGLAALAIELLNQSGFEGSFIQEVKTNGNTFYRSVIPMPSEAWIDVYKRKIKDLDYFANSEDGFITDLPEISTPRTAPRAPATRATPTPRVTPAPAPATKTTPTETTRTISASEVSRNSESMTRSQYVTLFAPKAREAYRINTGRELSQEQATHQVGAIYDNAKRYHFPVVTAFSVAIKESSFVSNAIGDRNLGDDQTAHGKFQIRKPTIAYVLDTLRNRNERDLPTSVDAAISSDDALTRLGVAHLGLCYQKYNGNLPLAVRCHNSGLWMRGRNSTPYVRDVLGKTANFVRSAGQNNYE